MLGLLIGMAVGLVILHFQGQIMGSSETKSSFYKIDDKNYIINNEFVSLEEDTPLLRLQQQMEDDKIWFEYEREQLEYHRERLFNIWKATTEREAKTPEFKINNKRLILIADEYENYLKECNAFDETLKLTKEQFAFYKFNKWVRMFIPMNLILNPHCGVYYLHNPKTARYKDNMRAILQKEFNDKYFSNEITKEEEKA